MKCLYLMSHSKPTNVNFKVKMLFIVVFLRNNHGLLQCEYISNTSVIDNERTLIKQALLFIQLYYI